MKALQPPGWPRPKGYSNGMMAEGRILVTGGIVGWNEAGEFPEGFVAQARQVLENICTILAEGGAKKLYLRAHASVDKNGLTVSDPGVNADEATAFGTQPTGMGWFPGYAIDLVTGERLNMAFRLGKAGSTLKSGCMNARYSMSFTSPASGQKRTGRSGSCLAKVSRHAWALPMTLSRLTMSSAMQPPGRRRRAARHTSR